VNNKYESLAWKIVLNGKKTDMINEEVFKLFDVEELFGGYPAIEDEFFNGLEDIIRVNEHYLIIQEILNVINPDDIEMLKDVFTLVIARDEMNNLYGFLFIEIDDPERAGFYLIAVWPWELRESIGRNIEVLDDILSSMITEPEKWKRVEMLVP